MALLYCSNLGLSYILYSISFNLVARAPIGEHGAFSDGYVNGTHSRGLVMLGYYFQQ